MTKDQNTGVMWKLLFGIVTCLFFALPALSDSSKLTKTSCPGEFSKQSTLPTSLNCNMVRLPDGTMLQTVPKLFSTPAVFAGKIPGQHIVCRIPDCGKNLCKNGRCEETMVGYNCTCSSGFQGEHCDEIIVESTTELKMKPTTSPTTTISERSNTSTSQNTTTSESVTAEAKTKSEPSPTTTMPERLDATTSQETTASKSAESSTSDATTKPAKNPTTTMSDTTTLQDTTTYTCSSPLVEGSYGGSFYNFSTCFMNYASAVSACSQFGSHLVFIESKEEEDFIVEHGQSINPNNTANNYWIGLTGSSPSDARWLDGSNLTYSNLNQNSFSYSANCLRILISSSSSWRVYLCSGRLRFICEKEVGI